MLPPNFPIAVSVVAGILAAKLWHAPLWVWWLAGIVAVGVTCKATKYWPIFFAIFCMAALRTDIAISRTGVDPLRNFSRAPLIVQFRPLEESCSMGDSFRTLVRVRKIMQETSWEKLEAIVLVSSEQPLVTFADTQAIGTLDTLSPKLRFYHEQGCHTLFKVQKILNHAVDVNLFQKRLIHIRHWINSWLMQSLPFPNNTVAEGILLGNHRDIPSDLLESFRVTGTYHVLVASGLKVALVALLLWKLSFFLPFMTRLVLSALGIIFYTMIVGFEPPVMRAALMSLIAMMSIGLRRGSESFSAFLWVAIVLLIIEPLLLFDAGFQLSFLSVLGILLLYQKIANVLSFLPRWLASSVSLTLSAQLLIIIPLVYYFHNLSFISPVSNLLIVPLTAASMFLGSLSLIGSLIWKSFGYGIAFWHRWVLSLMIVLLHFFSQIPGSNVWLSTSSIKDWFVPTPTLTFLDVGQGDCSILSVNHKTFLIDGGGSTDELVNRKFSVGENIVVPALHAQGVNRIEGILLTHPHRDHVGGLIAVIRKFPVKQVWLPRLPDRSPIYRTFLREIASHHVSLVFVQGNEKIKLTNHITWRLFWPLPPLLHGTHSDLNNNSIVSQLTINDAKVLLAGDVEIEGEEGLLSHMHPKSLLKSDLLKVPHHGSGTSSTEGFLRAVSPKVAVVSVGLHNPYHHPSPLTLKRLQRRGIRVFRTDQQGSIQFRFFLSGGRTRIKQVAQPIPQ